MYTLSISKIKQRKSKYNYLKWNSMDNKSIEVDTFKKNNILKSFNVYIVLWSPFEGLYSIYKMLYKK